MRSTGRRLSLVILFTMLFAATKSASPQPIQEVAQWNRVEQVLTSSKDYVGTSGNPYRDLILSATFVRRSDGAIVRNYGFWDGGSTFKVRTALPPGTWDWTVACTGTSNGQNCSGDLGLTQSVRNPIVSQFYSDGLGISPLYIGGFVRSSPSGRYLTYANSANRFFWSADTAWSAITDSNAAHWSTYVGDRIKKKFTTVLLALAPAYFSTPDPVGTSFQQGSGSACNTLAIPNDCSRWIPSFWARLDAMVEEANFQGLLVVLAGVIDPVDRGQLAITAPNGSTTTYKYPRVADARVFARNLAARMAGNHVIFSLGFDDLLGDPTADTAPAKTVADAMSAAAAEIRMAAPRHLITNHLRGLSSASDYQTFQGLVDLQVFQSGHAGQITRWIAAGACVSGDNPQRCATRRAKDLADSFYGAPTVRPSANGEAGYDYPGTVNPQPPDSPFGIRHTSYLSTLSGSFGATLGVKGIYDWTNPVAPGNLTSAATLQMTYLATRFRLLPWQDLVPVTNRILNNTGLPPEGLAVMAATASNQYALVYAPNSTTVEINTASFPGLSCTSSSWTKTRWDPRTNLSAAITSSSCADAAGRIVLSRPACTDSSPGTSGGCDWLYELRYTAPGLAAKATPAFATDQLAVWVEPSSDGSATAIMAQRVDARGSALGSPIVVEPQGHAFHKLPKVARRDDGGFLVVWQAEGLDSDRYGIFGRLLDRRGEALGESFRINTTTYQDQSDPAIATDSSGGFTIAWVSYDQDGDQGGIFAQRLDAAGRLLGPERQINSGTQGHQSSPLIATNSLGDLVVAWDSEERTGNQVKLRLFDRDGRARGTETRARVSGDDREYLADLQIGPDGSISVGCVVEDARKGNWSRVREVFSRDGQRFGTEVRLNDD